MSDEGKWALEAAYTAFAEHPYSPGERGSVKAAIRAYFKALPGWRLVPEAVTLEMERAALCEMDGENGPEDIFPAMAAAAPPPPGLGD